MSMQANPLRVHLGLVREVEGMRVVRAACNRPGAYRMTTIPERITCLACKRIEKWGERVPLSNDQR